MIPKGELFTADEISAATGKSQSYISAQITRRKAAGLLNERPKGKKGAPALYSYDEVKVILYPMPRGRPPTPRTDFGPDPQRIALLRQQLRTDGIAVSDKHAAPVTGDLRGEADA